MHRLRRSITMGMALALSALSACRASTAPEESDLAQARQRWALNTVRSYDFTGAVSCFCTTDALRAVTVSVTDGVVMDSRVRGNDERISKARVQDGHTLARSPGPDREGQTGHDAWFLRNSAAIFGRRIALVPRIGDDS
jgi:hypothetical protein